MKTVMVNIRTWVRIPPAPRFPTGNDLVVHNTVICEKSSLFNHNELFFKQIIKFNSILVIIIK